MGETTTQQIPLRRLWTVVGLSLISLGPPYVHGPRRLRTDNGSLGREKTDDFFNRVDAQHPRVEHAAQPSVSHRQRP